LLKDVRQEGHSLALIVEPIHAIVVLPPVLLCVANPLILGRAAENDVKEEERPYQFKIARPKYLHGIACKPG